MGRIVAGATVLASIRSETRTATTDSAGNACLLLNRYLGTSVSGKVSVIGADCSVSNQPFTSSTSGGPCQ
jgi:hypothetical protein